MAKIFYASLVFISSVVLLKFFNTFVPKHPDAGLDVEQLVRKYGYYTELHEVITEDGYILTLHRITRGNETQNNGVPILLMHGSAHSSFNFVQLGPKNSLSYLLVDCGYDVWLGNVRGTTWSRKHKHLNPDDDEEFWNFSLHDIGIYDVPAHIDYILNVTKHEALQYLGYSQGATVFFIMGAEKPEYNEKISLMSALAPAIFMKDPDSTVVRLLANSWKMVEGAVNLLNIHEFAYRKSIMATYFETICNENTIFADLCLHHMYSLFGHSPDETDKNILSLEFSQSPAGISTRQMLHHFQNINSGEFLKYDFGELKNLEVYGQKDPPHYQISKVNAPIAIYYSGNDGLVNVKNMGKLLTALPNVVKTYKVPKETFNHYDFTFAKNVVSLLYESVIDEILKY